MKYIITFGMLLCLCATNILAAFCPSCGIKLKSESKYCPSCGSDVATTAKQDIPKPIVAKTENYKLDKAPLNYYSSVKEPIVSATYSLVVPGAGHLYTEQPNKFFVFFVSESIMYGLWNNNPNNTEFRNIFLLLKTLDIINVYKSSRDINFYLSNHDIGIRQKFDWSK